MPVSAIVGAALGLARLIPDVAGLVAGDDAEETAEQVVETVQAVTGTKDPEAAKSALEADPALRLEAEKAVLAFRTRRLEEQSRRLAEVNATMRRESGAEDAFVRRWRPAFGYVVAASWAVQFGAIAWTMVANPQGAAALVEAVVALTPVWGIALGVLGVQAVKRSEDKRTAAGLSGGGLLGGLLGGSQRQ